jgi:hypothetical protein
MIDLIGKYQKGPGERAGCFCFLKTFQLKESFWRVLKRFPGGLQDLKTPSEKVLQRLAAGFVGRRGFVRR